MKTEKSLHPLEEVVEGESGIIKDIVELLKKQLDQEDSDPKKKMRRKFHGHDHGCVAATFTVNGDFDEEYKKGIFKKPGNYKAIVRFSNLQKNICPDTNNDRLPDPHGMGIKIFYNDEVVQNSPTQDFLMTNHPIFFAKDVSEYKNFIEDKGMFFFLRRHAFDIAYLSKTLPMLSPLRSKYFSMTPYALGNGAMKFMVQPCGDPVSAEELAEHTKTLSSKNPDYLMKALKERLEKGKCNSNICFDFKIQLRPQKTDDEHGRRLDEIMPVEDPRVDWPAEGEHSAAFQTVAKITIEPQTFDTPEKNKASEYLQFDPWHADEELRPLGGLNRSRRKVYQALSDYRREKSSGRLKDDSILSKDWAQVFFNKECC